MSDHRSSSQPDSNEELRLIARIRDGEADLFEKLISPHENVVRMMIRQYLQSAEDVHDVMQTTWLKSWLNLTHFRGQSRFRSWVVRIAINEALQLCRVKNRARWVSMDQTQLPVEVKHRTAIKPNVLSSFLQRALDELPCPYNRTLRFHAVDGLTDSEIATTENISLTAAKSRLYRAKNLMRKQWSPAFAI